MTELAQAESRTEMPKLRFTMICLALALVLGWSGAAVAAKRVALVIGTDRYATLPSLNNAATDARGMAKKLKRFGFDVILKLNASQRAIGRALDDFENRLRQAEVGLVFYAGHGIQARGKNWLIPADATVETEADLRYEGISAGDFLGAMERAGSQLNIVILDACRDNPLPKRTRSAARGLTVPVIPSGLKGTAIVYSASPGETAEDGPKGSHGVFTGELLKVLDRPGLKLEDVFKETARRVSSRTNGRQKPWINSSVTGDFYFKTASRPQAKRRPTTPPSTSGGTAASSAEMEALFWQSIQNSRDAADFNAYITQYPNGTFTGLARNRLKGLKGLKKRRRASIAPARRPTSRPARRPARQQAQRCSFTSSGKHTKLLINGVVKKTINTNGITNRKGYVGQLIGMLESGECTLARAKCSVARKVYKNVADSLWLVHGSTRLDYYSNNDDSAVRADIRRLQGLGACTQVASLASAPARRSGQRCSFTSSGTKTKLLINGVAKKTINTSGISTRKGHVAPLIKMLQNGECAIARAPCRVVRKVYKKMADSLWLVHGSNRLDYYSNNDDSNVKADIRRLRKLGACQQVASITWKSNQTHQRRNKLRGVNIWVNTKKNEKALGLKYCKMFREAGMNVRCDAGSGMASGNKIMLKCPKLPADAGIILQEIMGVSGWKVWDWRKDKDYANNCKSFHAISFEAVR